MKLRRIVFLVSCVGSAISALSLNISGVKSSPPQQFPLELDHVFVWVSKGAPEAEIFEEAGLHLQPQTHRHVGQGTASKIFIFENVYLELIWIEDEQVAAKSAERSGINLLKRARWKQTGTSPFGVGLHRRAGNSGELPFPIRHYWAEWMQPNTIIEFAQSVSDASEPAYFVVPEYLSIGSPAGQQMMGERLKSNPHRLGVSRLTNLKIMTTGKRLTSTSETLMRAGVVIIERGTKPLAELTFDSARQNKTIDLRPKVPLVLKY